MISLPNSVILFGLDFDVDFEQTLGGLRRLAVTPLHKAKDFTYARLSRCTHLRRSN